MTLPVSTVSSPGCARPNPSGGYRYGFEPGPPPRRRGSPVTAVSGVLGPLGSGMSPGRTVPHRDAPCPPGRTVPTGTHRAHRDAPCPPGRTMPTGTHGDAPCPPGGTGTHRAHREARDAPCPPGRTMSQPARHRALRGSTRVIGVSGVSPGSQHLAGPARPRRPVLNPHLGPYLILTSEGGDQIGCRPAAVEQGANVPTGAPQRLEGRDALQGLTARDVENDRIPRGGGD